MKSVNEQIWLTFAVTDTDVPNALTLCFSLTRTATSRKIGVIVSPQVSRGLREALDSCFDFVFTLQEDRNVAGLKDVEFAKFFGLTLRNFKLCVMLAPTMLALENCDELFDWGEQNVEKYASSKDTEMSVFVFRPSLKAFNRLLKESKSKIGRELISTTAKYIEDKYNRNLLDESEILLETGKDILMVHLPARLGDELETLSLGLVGQMVLMLWRNIRWKNVQPLLETSTNVAMLKEQPKDPENESIAIVGMSCRYPGANSLEEFWDILLAGKDVTGKPPSFRWLQEQCSKPVKPAHLVINAGFLKCPLDEFDAKFFGLSPKEMSCLDPQHRILHELVWEGLENAAINPQSLEGTNGGVFIGSWTNDFKEILTASGNDDFFRKYMGNSIGAGAARISHLLGLTGPSVATESGCSAAIVAVHLACKSLERRETNLALACGVNLLLNPFDKETMPMVLSPDGRCKTFDAKADGFGSSEGAGVLVLKRASDAIRDGDKIWALIRGSGMSQEGLSKSMGTPTVHSESLAMTLALQDANINPSRVSYVEAHGTGTAVGDPLEIASIAKAYHSKERKEPLLIGSVKTNVGHTESCSGITGIMKVVLAMQHEIIPPHRNLETLNPAIDLEAVPAQISLQPVEWKKREGITRMAGVSSFGITGTDAHAILQEPPNLPGNSLAGSSIERPLHIMKISAKTEEVLEMLLDKYKTHLAKTGSDFRDVAYIANIGRTDFSQRAILIAKSKEFAIKNIEQNKILRGNDKLGKIGFLFTGQGSQYSGMAKQLYETSPVFRLHFEYCEKILKNNYNIDITQVLWSNEKSAEVSRTIYSQTSIFCVEYALLKLWESWGVKPDYALGHSLGEFAAAVCAGIMSVEDALKLVAERSRLIDELPRGKMLVIKADNQKVDMMMNEFADGNSNKMLDYAAINSLEQTVVAGESEVVLHFAKFCKDKSLKCMVLEATHAFHSKHMNPMLDDYRTVANTIKMLSGNDCKFISGMRGSIVEAEKIDSEYWVDHTREKVSFLDASQKAVKLGCRTFIEIGPQPVLSALTMMNNDDKQLTCLSSLKRNEENWETLLNTLGKLYVTGATIDWKGFERFYRRSKVPLPHYPFTGKKYWPDLKAALGVSLHPLLGSPIPNASSTKLFQAGLNLSALEFIKDHAIGGKVIFPGAGYLEMCLAAGIAAVEGSTDSLPLPTRPMKVENLRIEAPLSLVESETCQLQTVVEFNESQGNWNDMKVAIYRRIDSESGKWLPHANATFCPVPSAEEKELQFDIERFKKTLELSPRNEELAQFYHKVASVGLNFGPAFKSIEQIWRVESTPNVLLAKVKVPATDVQNEYILHPVLLDAMIQAIVILIHGSNIKMKLYVPIRIGKFVWHQKMDQSKGVYIQVSNSIQVSALLVDSSGSVLAEMSSVELMDTTVKAIESVLEQQKSPLPDMWEEVWRGGLGPCQHSVDLTTGEDQRFYSDEFEALMKSYNNPSLYLAETFRELEQFSYLHILKVLYQCGWKPELNKTFKIGELAEQLCIKTDFHNYFRFMLETLAAEGILQLENDSWSVKRIPPTLGQLTSTIDSPLFSSNLFQKFQPIRLFSKLGQELSQILRGEQSALNTLFPEEATKEHLTLQGFYDKYQEVFLLSESFSNTNKQRLAQLRDSMGGQRFILRVLEVGAGTGSFSAHFLKCLEEEGIEFEYTYTDISAAFFHVAQKRFEKYGKHLKFKKLNIEEDPVQQGFSPEYYDFVYMAEVIHATKDIRESLGNIRKLMKPHAKMDMLESTRENRIITFIFGVLAGYWRYTDFDIRSRHCIISPQKWATVFEETGFKVDHSFPIHNSYHSYILVHKTAANIPAMLAATKKAWIVFHEPGSPLSNFLMEKIQNSAMRKVISVTKGKNFKNDDGTQFEVRTWEAQDFRSLLESISKMGLEVEGVLYCWALNKMLSTQAAILQPYFYLAQSVLNHLGSKTRLVALTENGAAAPLEEKTDFSQFHQATLWGFTKSLKNENASLNCKCIEVDTPAGKDGMMEVFHEIWQADNEIQVAFQGATRYVPRFQPHKPASSPLKLPTGTDKYCLNLPESKAIADLQFGPLELGNLSEDHVEVEIRAMALNFRDVLSVIKPTEKFRDINGVGLDIAGVVIRVGKRVTRWKVGDRVFGFNTNPTAFPSHVQLDDDALLPVPEELSYCEAATIPAVYTTSILCLLDVAKIQKEDVVLLHTASGGVGLSAIEICKFIGCTIIATAGSKRKQNYLKSIGIQHIFHSRNTQFGDQILELTGGRGVDVVLNSLTSEGFKEATLKACAKGARFVEMSKLNVWSEAEVKELRPDVKYTIADASSLKKDELRRVFSCLAELLQKNVAKAIPYEKFDGLNVREALNYLQKAKHIGKIVCVMPELRRSSHSGELAVYTPFFNERATYLITGGLGGIGFVVCNWMVEKGARHVLLAGRSPPSSSTREKINQLNSQGANVIAVQLDVGNFEECRNLIENFMPKTGLPPLRGVMHAAGTLADGVILKQDWTKLSSTFKTKIDGTMNLHELTKHLNLEHFVMFSSMAALLGSPGQCNHAAGNCFEDALTHYRHSLGLPSTTINWGQWGEVGIATEVDLPGFKTISNTQGITSLEYALKTQSTQLSVFNVDSFAVLSNLLPYLTTYLDERIWKTAGVSVKSSSTLSSKEFWQQYDCSSGVEGKGNVIKAQVRTILRNTLRMEENEAIGDNVDMQEMGVDSLMFVEIKNGLQTLLDNRLILSASVLRDASTVNQITSTIVGLIGGTQAVDCKPTMEQVNQLIREDSQLPLEIRAKPGQQTVAVEDIKSVFLTGATGTLGPYLLKELTSLHQITQVVCLIRPTKAASAEERLNALLLETGLLQNILMEKIRCVIGNVALPQLGMTKDDWEELSGSVDAVFNCSARVTHTELYKKRSSNSDTRAVNIGGMKNLLEFACEKKLKHFAHASSLLGVFTTDEDGKLSENWPEVEDYDNLTALAYPISKFVCDMLAKEAVERGIPCKVLRLPFIQGEEKTGCVEVETNHLLLRYIFMMKSGFMPDTPLPIIALPVDTCANVCVRLAFDKRALPDVYNIGNESPDVDQAFVSIAKRFGREVKIVESAEYFQRVQDEDDENNALELFKELYNNGGEFMSLFSNNSINKWREGQNVYKNKKVVAFIPNFYEDQRPTMEYVYNDLMLLKQKGLLGKFGL